VVSQTEIEFVYKNSIYFALRQEYRNEVVQSTVHIFCLTSLFCTINCDMRYQYNYVE
jgi:hypothetical protein